MFETLADLVTAASAVNFDLHVVPAYSVVVDGDVAASTAADHWLCAEHHVATMTSAVANLSAATSTAFGHLAAPTVTSSTAAVACL